MSDFFQNGVITTLQNLGGRTIEDIESELEKLSERRGMVLLLPALYSEFETPSMQKIIDELKSKNSFGHDGISTKLLKHVKSEISNTVLLRMVVQPSQKYKIYYISAISASIILKFTRNNIHGIVYRTISSQVEPLK